MSKKDIWTIICLVLKWKTSKWIFSHSFGFRESAFSDTINFCRKIADQIYFNCAATQVIAAWIVYLNHSTLLVLYFLHSHAERFDNLFLRQNPIDLQVRIKWYFSILSCQGYCLCCENCRAVEAFSLSPKPTQNKSCQTNEMRQWSMDKHAFLWDRTTSSVLLAPVWTNPILIKCWCHEASELSQAMKWRKLVVLTANVHVSFK